MAGKGFAQIRSFTDPVKASSLNEQIVHMVSEQTDGTKTYVDAAIAALPTVSTSEFRGALATPSADYTLAADGAWHTIPINTRTYDTDDFLNINTYRFTVPAGVEVVRVSYEALATGTGFAQPLFTIWKRGAYAVGLPLTIPGTYSTDSYNAVWASGTSAPLQVETGDYFELKGYLAPSTTASIQSETWFSIEVIR